MKFTRLVTDASRLGFSARDALRGAVSLAADDDVKRDEGGRFAVHAIGSNKKPGKNPVSTHRKEVHFDRPGAEKHKRHLEGLNPNRSYAILPHSGEGKGKGEHESAQAGFARRANAYLSQKWTR